jgi:hypothetical protein
VVTWFDYTTTPPTFHARKLANLATATIDAGVDQVRAIAARPRYDLQLAAVILRYKQINEVNGMSFQSFATEKYPGNASETQVGASVHTIELAGSRTTNVSATITTATILAQNADETVREDWWKSKIPWLRNEAIDGLSITVADVVDENGDPVTNALTTYPRELVGGQIADWMNKSQKTLIIKATASYTRYRDGSDKKHELRKTLAEPITVKVQATNAVSGTFSTIQSFQSGEVMPSGLAQTIYDAHAVLQHDGEVEIVGEELKTGCGVGNKLTLIGGSLTLSNLLVQESTEQPHFGRLQLRLGPAKQLGVADLIELLRVNRFRVVYNLPSSRTSGSPSGGGQVGLGKDMPKENSTADQQAASFFATMAANGGYHTQIKADAEAEEWQVQRVDSAGARAAGESYIELHLADCTSENVKRNIKIREVPVCIDGVQKYCLIPRSEYYTKT